MEDQEQDKDSNIVDKQGNTRLFSESSPDLSANNIDENFNIEENSISSCSSVEPRSECSYTDNEQILKNNKVDKSQQHKNLDNSLGRESALSDYVANHTVPLPDFSAPPTESEEDDFVSVTSSKIGDATWEDNWLFRKKRSSLSNSTSTTGCGMLVPAPTEDIRAQIGDKTADEISDLSEFGSDTDDSSIDLLHTKSVNNRVLNKHVIGGENTKMALDELIECASIVSGTLIEETEPTYTETKNEQITQILSTKMETFNEHVNNVSSTKGEQLKLADQIECEPISVL
ncbi:uncharacterized protein LOC119685454 [Teleopsis dalmanni]|uniref:uncharacterized protein LOC119685454 n=1 Tax=Teleopsis dalmanni TaxID=139649 RepID=UPI0018CD861A|nr:uncharacterized protein LOC119685454 [Teleopsis dalmanni]